MGKQLILFLLTLTMLIWAANFYVVKVALAYYSPMGVAAFRFLFAVILLYGIVVAQQKKLKIKLSFSKQQWWYLFLTAFFGTYLTIYFFNKGLTTANPINSSLILATGPIFTAIFARFMLNRQLSIVQWFAIFLSIFGVAVLLVQGDLMLLLNLRIEPGDGYIILMSIVLSLSQIIVNKYLADIDSIILTVVTCAIALVLFTLSCLSEIATTSVPSDFNFWASILFMGLLGTGLGYVAFYQGILKLGATKTTLFMNLIPFFVVIIAIPFGEQILISQFIGGLIIIFGLFLFNRENRKGIVLN